MKKIYVKPAIEIELYELDSNIASNCVTIRDFGPGNPITGDGVCDGFPSWGLMSTMSTNTSFYQPGDAYATCDCYYTAGGESYFTS